MQNKSTQELKQRLIIWLYPSQIEKMEKLLGTHNMKNKSDFIDKSLEFYMGYLQTQDSTEYLSQTLVGAMQGMRY